MYSLIAYQGILPHSHKTTSRDVPCQQRHIRSNQASDSRPDTDSPAQGHSDPLVAGESCLGTLDTREVVKAYIYTRSTDGDANDNALANADVLGN